MHDPVGGTADDGGPVPRSDPDRPGVPAVGLREWVRWFGLVRMLSVAVAVVAVGAGGYWLLRTPSPDPVGALPVATTSPATTVASPATVPSSVPPSTVTVSSAPASLVVHVAGAVARPGVYELSAGSRVHDAIDAAGGAGRRADPSALNLAEPIVDGSRIVLPRVGEEIAQPVSAPARTASVGVAASDGDDATAASPTPPVDVNRADLPELETLPGVGPATAAAIVDEREVRGPFASLEDLERVRGIGPATVERLRGLVAW